MLVVRKVNEKGVCVNIDPRNWQKVQLETLTWPKLEPKPEEKAEYASGNRPSSPLGSGFGGITQMSGPQRLRFIRRVERLKEREMRLLRSRPYSEFEGSSASFSTTLKDFQELYRESLKELIRKYSNINCINPEQQTQMEEIESFVKSTISSLQQNAFNSELKPVAYFALAQQIKIFHDCIAQKDKEKISSGEKIILNCLNKKLLQIQNETNLTGFNQTAF
jgi:hypothetical protein